MSLYGAFDSKRCFAELADPVFDQHGNLLTPTVRRNTVLQNLTGNATILASELAALQGLTATSAELNLLDGTVTAAELAFIDGALATNAVASKAAILDTGGDLVTASNVGTSAATSVKEYGDGFHHVTVLTMTGLAFGASEPDNESLAIGDLIYTFPAGAVILEHAYMNVALTQSGTPTTDTPDVGLGTVIGTGVVTTLDGTATFEDIITGQTAVDVAGTAIVTASLPTVGAPLFIASGDAHTVHVNAADAWQDITTPGLLYTGVVVLTWKFLE